MSSCMFILYPPILHVLWHSLPFFFLTTVRVFVLICVVMPAISCSRTPAHLATASTDDGASIINRGNNQNIIAGAMPVQGQQQGQGFVILCLRPHAFCFFVPDIFLRQSLGCQRHSHHRLLDALRRRLAVTTRPYLCVFWPPLVCVRDFFQTHGYFLSLALDPIGSQISV